MADILIRGMKMPKSGYVEMLLKVWDGEVYYNNAGEREIKTADYIPLPAGHGRLIDADYLLRDHSELADCDFIHPKYDLTLRELIDDAPTIVPAEGRTE